MTDSEIVLSGGDDQRCSNVTDSEIVFSGEAMFKKEIIPSFWFLFSHKQGSTSIIVRVEILIHYCC